MLRARDEADMPVRQGPRPGTPGGDPGPSLPYGRKTWPPPLGSGYEQFLDWAADGDFPREEDARLAVGLWAGWIEHPGQEPRDGPGRY